MKTFVIATFLALALGAISLQPAFAQRIARGKTGSSRINVRTALATDPAPNGVRVMQVMPGSPAAEVGLRSGDVITRVDNRIVSTPQQVIRAVTEKQPGEQVSVVVDRNGQRRSFEVRLAERQQALDPRSRESNVQRRDSR